jgi:predicted enzyme related to lactoylglutathione lyase
MDTSGSSAGPAAGIPAYVVVDTQDPDKITPFWCSLLGVEVIQRRDEGHIVVLGPASSLPGEMLLVFQRVPEAKSGKNRVHIDMYVDDIDATAGEIQTLGGTWTDEGTTLDDGGWISRIMADPEGNEFCICLTPSKAEQRRSDLDQVIVHNAGRIKGAGQ